MMSEALAVSLSVGGFAVLTTLIQSLPQIKTRKDIKKISENFNIMSKDVKVLKDYMIANTDIDKIQQKFSDIQCYYLSKIDEKYKAVAIMKSDTFINLIVDGLTLNMDNVTNYTIFQDHLFAASKYNEQRMKELLGEEITQRYYQTHRPNLIRYNNVIQKIFFTTENSKRIKFVSASIDFMQLFMTELVCLVNGETKVLLDECSQQARRAVDHN